MQESSPDNWVFRFQQHRLKQDTDLAVFRELRDSPTRLQYIAFLYHPFFEFFSLILVFISLIMLFLEMSHTSKDSVGWMNGNIADDPLFFMTDLVITVLFALEYFVKLSILPNRKVYFRKSIVDLLAILPLFRVFRLARTLRFLRMFRLIRAMKMEALFEYELVRKQSSKLFATENATILTYLILSVAFGTIGILIFERGINDGFQGFGDGLWWCFVTITTVGYGDISPITPGGKVIGVIIMFIGLSFYALLTGTISSVLINRAQSYKEKKMEISLLENHIIICGWSDDGVELMQNLLNTSKRYILIVTDRDIPFLEHQRILVKKADPSSNEVLQEVNIELAYSCIILSNNKNGSEQDIDAKSILICLAVQIANPQIHTIIELQNPKNEQHARNAGANELIAPKMYKSSLLAQSASSPGVSKVYSELFNQTTTHLAQQDLNETWEGRPYRELTLFALQNRLSCLGIIRDDKPILSPAGELILRKEDKLISLKTEDSSANSFQYIKTS